jgi:hypothetical protein
MLVFTAPGFLDTQLPISRYLANPTSETVVVGLVPRERATVRFVAQTQAPVDGVEASFLGTLPRGKRGSSITPVAALEVHRSNTSGELSIPLSCPSWFRYSALSGKTGEFVARPGSAVVVPIDAAMRRFRFTDQFTGAPLENLRVTLGAGSLGAERTSTGTTNALGEVRLVGVRGAQRLSVHDAATLVVRMQEDGEPVDCEETGSGQYILRLKTSTDDISAACTQDAFVIKAYDARDGSRVTAPFSWGRERAKSGGQRWYGFGESTPGMALDGAATINRERLTRIYKQLANQDQVTFWFEGYQPWSLSNQDSIASPLLLQLTPTGSKALFLTDVEGQPYRGEVYLVDLSHTFFLGSAVRGDSSGRLGPYPWSGGDWQLLDSGGKTIETLPAQTLAASDVIRIKVNSRCGSICLVDVPAVERAPVAAYLRAFKQSGYDRPLGARLSTIEGEWMIDDVVPGDYVVGPAEFVDWFGPLGPMGTTSGIPKITVSEGEETIVPWNADWSIDAPITGRVTASRNNSASLLLYKIFNEGRTRRFVSALGEDRVPLSESGVYVLDPGQTAPSALLVAFEYPRDESGLPGVAPLAVIEPGASICIDGPHLKLCTSAMDAMPKGIVVEVPIPDRERAMINRYIIDTTIDFYWMGENRIEIPFYGGSPSTVMLRTEHGDSGLIPLTQERLTADGYFFTAEDFDPRARMGGGLSR